MNDLEGDRAHSPIVEVEKKASRPGVRSLQTYLGSNVRFAGLVSGAVVVGLVAGAMVLVFLGSQQQGGQIPVPGADQPDSDPQLVPNELVSKWEYKQETDTLRGSVRNLSRVRSENKISTSRGENYVYLGLWSGERDAFIYLDGALMCDEYDNFSVSARVDDGPIEKWYCRNLTQLGTGVTYISPYRSEANDAEGLRGRIKAAQRVVVEIPVYGTGNQQAVFDVRGHGH